MIDLHSHLIPGIDDGAASLEEALNAIGVMERDGITRIVTTPHLATSLVLRPRELARYMERMDSAWSELAAAAALRYPGIELRRGVELALDALPPELTDERMLLGGTRCMLVEFPHFHVPPNSEYALTALQAAGIRPILAHPERYANLGADFAAVRAWKDHGAMTQVNSGSLIGSYGEKARQQAGALIALGLADFLSSDYHARGKCTMRQAAALLVSRGLDVQARMLTESNAALMLSDETPGPVPESEAPSMSPLRKLVQRLRRN